MMELMLSNMLCNMLLPIVTRLVTCSGLGLHSLGYGVDNHGCGICPSFLVI